MPRCHPGLIACLFTFALTAISSGCGGGDQVTLVPVHGTVTLDGQPLPDATVTFTPLTGRASFGVTDAQGRYQLKYTADRPGAVASSHKVTISTFLERDTDSSDPVKQAGRLETVPEIYNKKTTLQMEVSPADRDPMDFRLESKPKS